MAVNDIEAIRARSEERMTSENIGGVREWFDIDRLLRHIDELEEENRRLAEGNRAADRKIEGILSLALKKENAAALERNFADGWPEGGHYWTEHSSKARKLEDEATELYKIVGLT